MEMLAHLLQVTSFLICFFFLSSAEPILGTPSPYDVDHLEQIHLDQIYGFKEVLPATDNKSILIATLQLQDRCAISVVYTDFQPSTPQVPTLLSTHLQLTQRQQQPRQQDVEIDPPPQLSQILRPFSQLSSEVPFISCVSNGTDNLTTLTELQQPQTWSTILDQLSIITGDTTAFWTQRHFPEDIKGHTDFKRWIHLASMLVLIKDIVEHNVAFISDTSAPLQNASPVTSEP